MADATFARVAIRHTDISAGRFRAAACAIAENAPQVLGTVKRWQAKQLSETARWAFAYQAIGLRWTEDRPIAKALGPAQLLQPLRIGDAGCDLWTTFNVVQEHLVRGGDRYAPAIGSPMRFNTTRAIGGIQLGQQINQALWNLAEGFSRN